jgi:AhpD family alkylhydroperoxidase
MITEAMKYREQTMENFTLYKKLMPGVAQAYDEMPVEAYKDGALSGKTKRLMALCGALVHGCPACQMAQTTRALDLGASVEEILETCAVAISLGGTMGAGETMNVVQYLKEMGKIE